MSRPQYAAAQYPPNTVNGGLIDFQDNYNRGMAGDYQAYMAAQQGFPAPQMASPATLQFHAAGVNYPVPNMASPAALPGFQPGQAMQTGVVSGPPSYMCINGVKYAPVGDAISGDAKPKTADLPSEEPVKVLSERELERAIDERVHSRVNQFMAQQRSQPRRYDHEDPHERSSHRHPVDDYDMEDLAAKRIQSVNASMGSARRPSAKRSAL